MFTFLRQTFESVKAFLTPDRYFSWQTVLYMSLFSWLMSLLSRFLGASTFTIWLTATLSWAFLALGLGWALETNQVKLFGVSLAPWVAGSILCVFLFGSWGEGWLQPALIVWPLMSFAVVAVPNLLTWELKPKLPLPAIRQQLILWFFLSLLFSSWFQFYFRIQAWLQDYPSLVADNFDNSNFVYRIPGQAMPLSLGVTHLSQAEAMIRTQIDGKPWSSVERWLLNVKGQQQAIQEALKQNQGANPEEDLWQFAMQPIANGEGYTLKLWAIWQGPTADKQGYYLEKSCQLMPVVQPTPYETASPDTVPTRWAKLTCDLATPRLSGRPKV